MKTCVNHPGRKAFSVCHNCSKEYCEECLDEGKEYYYCKQPECQKMLEKELSSEEISSKEEHSERLPTEKIPAMKLSSVIYCPNCNTKLKLTKHERTSRKIHCAKCEAFIDLTINPPKVYKKENYVELVSTLNLGDIGLIKSILEDGKIEYYTTGENFLSADPLIVPVKFFVKENQIKESKELMKDVEVHIWGVSTNQ